LGGGQNDFFGNRYFSEGMSFSESFRRSLALFDIRNKTGGLP